jgi:hypothetical protein
MPEARRMTLRAVAADHDAEQLMRLAFDLCISRQPLAKTLM